MEETPHKLLQMILKSKYFAPAAVVALIVLMFSSFVAGRYSILVNLSHPTIQTQVNETMTQKSPDRPVSKISIPSMSSDNTLLLQLRSEETESSYSIDLYINDFDSPHSPIIFIDGEEVKNGELMKIKGEKDELQRMFGYFSNYASWSPRNDKFAVLLPQKILVFGYEAESVENDTMSPPRRKVSLTTLKEFTYDDKFDPYAYPSIKFSGNGSELYYSSQSGVRMLLPTEKVVNNPTGNSPIPIFPIPNSPGIAYWFYTQGVSDETHHSFIVNYGNSYKQYDLESDFSIDLKRELILSPGLNYACVGWESSGGGGKILFNLNTGKQSDLGTGCVRWINSNELVVYKNDSPGNNATGNISYYLVNLTTGEKTFLHNYHTSN